MRTYVTYGWLFLGGIVPWMGFSQSAKNYTVRTVAFYNVENLFDTVDDSLTFDNERTPEGKYHWTAERYHRKIAHISKVISEIGANVTKASPDLVGLCEVENREVVKDLVQHRNLVDKNYGIIHFDSPDERGIDVALLYKKEVFIPFSSDSRKLLLFNEEDERNYTRDQLVVEGALDEEPVYLIINHWPSRSGGEAGSRPNRLAAARLNRRIMDSVLHINPDARIISMGDLNDDPLDESLKRVLKTRGDQEDLGPGILFNPMENLYKKGVGSLAYRDTWNLFDQILCTSNLLDTKTNTYRFWRAGVFNPPYLITQKGKYKGYPFRTYAGGLYTGGYSDHFPVYMYLVREVHQTSRKGE